MPDENNFYNEKVEMQIPNGWQVSACTPKTGWSCNQSGSVVTWTNQSGADHGFDMEFKFTATAPSTAGTYYFKVFQTYNSGCAGRCTASWNSETSNVNPAPRLTVTGGSSVTTTAPAGSATTTKVRSSSTTTKPATSTTPATTTRPATTTTAPPSSGTTSRPATTAISARRGVSHSFDGHNPGGTPGAPAADLGSLTANAQGAIAGIVTVPASTAAGEYEVAASGPGQAGGGTLTASPPVVQAGKTLSLAATGFSPAAEVSIKMTPVSAVADSGAGFKVAQAVRTLTQRVKVVNEASGAADLTTPSQSAQVGAVVDDNLASTDGPAPLIQAIAGAALLGLAWGLRRMRRSREVG